MMTIDMPRPKTNRWTVSMHEAVARGGSGEDDGHGAV